MKQLLTTFAFISFCSFAQNDVTVTFTRRTQFYGYLRPIKLKINGENYKLNNKKTLVVYLKSDEKFLVKSNSKLNKNVIYEAALKENKALVVKYKFNLLGLKPIIIKE